MDPARFDTLSRSLATTGSRRRALAALSGALSLVLGAASRDEAEAKKKKKKKRKEQSPPPPPPLPGGGCTPDCAGKSCGAGNGCGGSCPTGSCPGTQVCDNGTCRASCSTTLCNGTCVDTQTSSQHCGGCNLPCSANQTCVGGVCQSAGCGANQLDCGNGVCAGGANPCCSYLDCGGGNGELVCDPTTHQCVCNTTGEGICKRFSNGAGLCDVCCGDGSHACIDDTVCVDIPDIGISTCDCPAGTTRCAGSQNAHKCQASINQDNRRCGIGCEDCTLRGPTSFCCFGECLTACEPNTVCNRRTCGGCQTCGEGTACCRSGTSHLFGCALLVNGACPGPAE